MQTWWMVAAFAVLVFLCAGPALRLVVAAVFGRQVASAALAQQPDTIHLVPAAASAWQDSENADRVGDAILALGFEDAGTFTIPELPGVTVRLLAHVASSTYAAIYQHARAGSWFEFFQRNTDGTGATFTSLPPTGLSDRPGHPVIRMPGADPASLFERVRRNRPAGAREAARAEDAVRVFEAGYAESIAWRKQAGVSRADVVRVAAKRVA